MPLQGREGGNRLRQLTTVRLISISFCTDSSQQLVQGNARLVQHPREHHAGVRGWGCRPPIQKGREQRRRKGPCKESGKFWKGLPNNTRIMKEGFNRSLQFSAHLLKAVSRMVRAKGCQVDSLDGLSAVEAAQDWPCTTLTEEVSGLRVSPYSAQQATGVGQEHFRRPTKEVRPHALHQYRKGFEELHQ